MKLPVTMASERMAGYRILVLAVFFSLAWHIFWLSAIKIIPSKTEPSQARFSKVSFLGPILSRTSLGMRAEPVKRSFLENRYTSLADKAVWVRFSADLPAGEKEAEAASAGDVDRSIPRLIDEAVSGIKVEPEHGAE